MSDTGCFRERVQVSFEAGVAEVCLVRPQKMNALDADMFTALLEAGEHVASLPDLRAVVLHAAGRAFCAGLDTAGFDNMASGRPVGEGLDELLARTHGIANRAQQVVWQWRTLPVPVVAALHGVAFGGGLQLALGADLRYASPDARLSMREVKWGLVPDMGGLALLRELARADHARDLVFSGRIVAAEEAARIGLVTAVVEDALAAARSFAAAVAHSSPDAIRAAKRLLNLGHDADAGAVLQAEAREQTALIASPNQREAVLAAVQKRSPRFRPAAER